MAPVGLSVALRTMQGHLRFQGCAKDPGGGPDEEPFESRFVLHGEIVVRHGSR